VLAVDDGAEHKHRAQSRGFGKRVPPFVWYRAQLE